MIGIGVKRTSGEASPQPITTEFSYAEIEGGQAGILDKTSSATATYWGAAGRTIWVGEITGTEAKLLAVRRSGTPDTGMINVSVDGGTLVAADYSGGMFTLFTGLTDIKHHVAISVGDAYGNGAGVANTGTVLSVTGLTPAIATPAQQLVIHDGNELYDSQSENITLTSGYAVYAPNKIYSGKSNYSAAMRFKINSDRLYVATASRYCYLSIDGGDPVRYDRGFSVADNFHVIECDGLQHTYNVWSAGGVAANVGQLSVGTNGSIYDVGTKRRLEQFGDSITAGAGSTTVGDVDVHGVAAYFDMLGIAYGVSGENAEGLNTRLTTLLPNILPSSSDVAVLAIGRNDSVASINTNYLNCINQLKAVYGKVLCRGVLPVGGTAFPDHNAAIESIVTTLADQNVVYIDPASWTGITSGDGTHPDDAGYDVIESYCKTAYASYLVPAEPVAVTTTYGVNIYDTLSPGFTCSSGRKYPAFFESEENGFEQLRAQYDAAILAAESTVQVLLYDMTTTIITPAELLADITELAINFQQAYTHDYTA